MAAPKILMEAHEGRVVSALFENGFLKECVDRGAEVHVITPGADAPGFRERYGADGVTFHRARLRRDSSKLAGAERRARGWLGSHGHGAVARGLWRIVGERLAAGAAEAEKKLIEELRPTVVFTPHVSEGFGRGLVAAARREGVPTVGNVMSWDNPYRPLVAWPDVLTCWSETTRRELAVMCAHPVDRTCVVGAPQFDPYFAKDFKWSRERLCRELGLDPARPIVLFATLGQFRPFMDETGTFAAYLEALDRGLIHGKPQTVLRLHPMSRSSYFGHLARRRDVVVSRFDGYIPGMMWAPTRDEVILAGNLLFHADACVSPGSTMTIETAIFDTPTLMPAFNPFMPDEYGKFFEKLWMQRHFRWLIEQGLVPVARSLGELADTVNRCMEDRAWYREQRSALRGRLLAPLDGRATIRLAELVSHIGRHGLQRGGWRRAEEAWHVVGAA